MSKVCCICQNPFEKGETFTLTDEEKEAIGKDAPNEMDYCAACMKVMKDRETGAQLLKGLYEMGLRESGFPANVARAMSIKFYEILTKTRKLH